MSLLWSDTGKRGKRAVFNPRPPIPKTGWKPLTDLPCLAGAKAISFDVETYDPDIEDHGPGWGRGIGQVIGVAIGTDDGFRKYLPIRHTEGFNHDVATVKRWLNEQLGRTTQPKVGHNVLYDLGWMKQEGITVRGETHDTWTAEKLLSHTSDAALEDLGQRYLGDGKDSSALYEWGWSYWGRGVAPSEDAKRKITMKHLSLVPPELVGFYAESDVDLPLRILPLQFERLERHGLLEVYRMECDLLPMLVDMRMAGVSVDLDAAELAHKDFGVAIVDLQKEIDVLVGRPTNTGSPKELSVAFDRLKLGYPRTEKGAPSFKGEFLRTLEHPLALKIVEIEELKKFQSTFIQGQILDSHVEGKVYCSFNPMRAVTGRFSCTTPNLQQTPSRSSLAKRVRSVFCPDVGHLEWRSYDYSSIESRLLAHHAVGRGAKALRKEYNDNPDTDYHSFTQAMIKKLVGLELVRKHVKQVNFAGVYGASENKLKRLMGISDEEAQVFFTAYHDGLPYVKETMEFLSRYAEEHGHTRTILGRKSEFNHWEPKFTARGKPRPMALPLKKAVKAYGTDLKRAYLHKALNHTLQGGAADLMKMAMVKCYQSGVFDVMGIPRLVVHDALECSARDASPATCEAFLEMKTIMENAIKFRVPIRVDGNRGPNWGEASTHINDHT